MTPEEKINYALSLVEGLSFCAYCGTPINEDEHCITGYRHTEYEPPHDAGVEQDHEYPMPTPVSANLIPAALRLALAALAVKNSIYEETWENGSGMEEVGTTYEDEVVDGLLLPSLDAFLALLPEPPKEG